MRANRTNTHKNKNTCRTMEHSNECRKTIRVSHCFVFAHEYVCIRNIITMTMNTTWLVATFSRLKIAFSHSNFHSGSFLPTCTVSMKVLKQKCRDSICAINAVNICKSWMHKENGMQENLEFRLKCFDKSQTRIK